MHRGIVMLVVLVPVKENCNSTAYRKPSCMIFVSCGNRLDKNHLKI